MWNWLRGAMGQFLQSRDRAPTARSAPQITYPVRPTADASAQPTAAVKITRPPNLKAAPPTLTLELSNPNLNRPVVFDPALKHFVNGRRGGEPTFATEGEATRWNAIRIAVVDHILHLIAASKWHDHLVLRGSVLLAAWYGDRARRPGDIDWVVTPAEWNLSDRHSKALLAGIETTLRGTTVSFDQQLTIPDRSFASTEIWSYERAPGQRIVVPWIAEDTAFNGTVQLDFVFAEPMPSPVVPTAIQFTSQPPANLLAATPEQSLCWKLLWLATDSYASGKDLFDAVLLAESTSLNMHLLKSTFELAKVNRDPTQELDAAAIKSWYVEWDDFQAEYPQHAESEDVWKQRLSTALGISSAA
jgi:hypothetical protein